MAKRRLYQNEFCGKVLKAAKMVFSKVWPRNSFLHNLYLAWALFEHYKLSEVGRNSLPKHEFFGDSKDNSIASHGNVISADNAIRSTNPKETNLTSTSYRTLICLKAKGNLSNLLSWENFLLRAEARKFKNHGKGIGATVNKKQVTMRSVTGSVTVLCNRHHKFSKETR